MAKTTTSRKSAKTPRKKPAKKTTAKKTTKKVTAKKASKTKKATTTKKTTKKSRKKATTVAKDEVAICRRRKPRRASDDEPELTEVLAADPKQEAAEAPKPERRKKAPRRRQIDPTTCERDYTDDEIEFMHALDEYKRANGRMFPTCSEVLEVVRNLGYVKIEKSDLETTDSTGATDNAAVGNSSDNQEKLSETTEAVADKSVNDAPIDSASPIIPPVDAFPSTPQGDLV